MTSMPGTVQLAFMKSFAVWNDFEIYTDTIGLVVILGSLSNHDDDGNKNPTNLHIWQWKTVFLHALHVHFSFFDIL